MKKIAILILFSMSATAIADKNTNVQGQTQYTKSKATGIGIGHSSSKSISGSRSSSGAVAINGGNRLKSQNYSGSYSRNQGNNHTDQSRSYAVAFSKADIPHGNWGFNTPIFGFSGMSKARIDLYLLRNWDNKGISKSTRQGMCARLSAKLRNRMDDCNKSNGNKKGNTVAIRVGPVREVADYDVNDTNGIGW